jgi:AAA+ ATPase superfamily predicted ATPase
MRLPFLDRAQELSRLKALLTRRTGSLAVIYGRRRCGKSRLLRQALPKKTSVYYVGDDRESSLQRSGMATEMGRLIPGFDRVTYPEWEVLLSRWWEDAHPRTVLALDELPALVSRAPEIPSLLQKCVDRWSSKRVHLILTGSSQRMMQGLVLDRAAPLYGRANEIVKMGPLPAGWISKALGLRDAIAAVEAYAVWGGVPRYWELAADHESLPAAMRSLVLSPMGVLHEEPGGLLRDDLRDTTQAASILSLIGQGCHRISEIAGRLGKPATSLSRPVQRLMELELVRREQPFGTSARDSKRTYYQIADPFLRFWFRYVEPNRSRLEAGQESTVLAEVRRNLPEHLGGIWEDLARESVARLDCFGRTWKPASRWWGSGEDRRPMEIDVVAESSDGQYLLLGEVEWSDSADCSRLLAELKRKAMNFPHAAGREMLLAIWVKERTRPAPRGSVFGPESVLRVLR